MKNYYFTFGTDPQYPYGINDYVLIRAENIRDAQLLFKERHPNRPGTDCLNYAFSYSEKEFIGDGILGRFYGNREPVEIIE